VKRTTSGTIQVSESLQRQASSGVIRKGGIESKLDVVSRDYVPPPRPEAKRSRSTPAMVRPISCFRIDRVRTDLIFIQSGILVTGL
jgi:cell division cycle protein 20 (cofactor of APC complex)